MKKVKKRQISVKETLFLLLPPAINHGMMTVINRKSKNVVVVVV